MLAQEIYQRRSRLGDFAASHNHLAARLFVLEQVLPDARKMRMCRAVLTGNITDRAWRRRKTHVLVNTPWTIFRQLHEQRIVRFHAQPAPAEFPFKDVTTAVVEAISGSGLDKIAIPQPRKDAFTDPHVILCVVQIKTRDARIF